MRSEVRFIMHPDDEREFAKFVRAESDTVFVNGPKWKTPEPPITTDINDAGNYLMIWNPTQTPEMKAQHYDNEHGEWWYCKSEYFTIQLLRSGFQYGESFLFEGRIAVCTTDKGQDYFHESSALLVEQRFKSLRKWIRKSYRNKVLIYQNPALPRSQTNPIKPAADIWIGPCAMNWLEADPANHWVQPFRQSNARGYLVDLVELDLRS